LVRGLADRTELECGLVVGSAGRQTEASATFPKKSAAESAIERGPLPKDNSPPAGCPPAAAGLIKPNRVALPIRSLLSAARNPPWLCPLEEGGRPVSTSCKSLRHFAGEKRS